MVFMLICRQMDLVSSFVMLITSRLAARASVYKYPVVSFDKLTSYS